MRHRRLNRVKLRDVVAMKLKLISVRSVNRLHFSILWFHKARKGVVGKKHGVIEGVW